MCGASVSPNEINKKLELTHHFYYSGHDGRTKTSNGGGKSNAAQHRASSISPHACASFPSKLQRHRGTRRVDNRNEGSIPRQRGLEPRTRRGPTDVVEAWTTSKTARTRTRTNHRANPHIGVTSIPTSTRRQAARPLKLKSKQNVLLLHWQGPA
jgi:hypothetical protein